MFIEALAGNEKPAIDTSLVIDTEVFEIISKSTLHNAMSASHGLEARLVLFVDNISYDDSDDDGVTLLPTLIQNKQLAWLRALRKQIGVYLINEEIYRFSKRLAKQNKQPSTPSLVIG